MTAKDSHGKPQAKAMVKEEPPRPELQLFREFEEAMLEMERRLDRIVRDNLGENRDLWRFPVLQGLSLQPGPDGRLRFQPFGHVHESLEAFMEGWRQPVLTWSMKEEGRAIEFRAEVPGLRKDELEVEVLPDGIRVRGEPRGEGANARQARFAAACHPGMQLEPGSAQAHCEAGVLVVSCRVREPARARPRKVAVE